MESCRKSVVQPRVCVQLDRGGIRIGHALPHTVRTHGGAGQSENAESPPSHEPRAQHQQQGESGNDHGRRKRELRERLVPQKAVRVRRRIRSSTIQFVSPT